MVREVLRIYVDDGSSDNPTFHDIQLTEYTFKEPRMGMPSLTATLMWPACLDSEWTRREYVTLRGERYYIREIPTSSKNNDDARYRHELSFRSERDDLLGGLLFRDVVPSHALTADRPCSNSTTVKFYGTTREFIDRLNCAFLEAGVGDSILKTKTDLTTEDTVTGDGYCAMRDPSIDSEPKVSHEYSFEDKYLWDVISDGYGINGVPFEFRGKRIIYGAAPNVVDRVFRYGHDNELLKIEKANANARIINRITMSGSTENIPHYYPNETEYGHIGAVAVSTNTSLKTSQITIANMRQMLSAIPQGENAIFHEGGTGSGDALADIPGYSLAVGDGTLAEYALGQPYAVTIPQNVSSVQLMVAVYFIVNEPGEYVCDEIRGNIWSPNTAPPSDSTNIMDSVTPVYFGKTVAYEDISGQMQATAVGISLGRLDSNFYRLTFSVELQNRDPRYESKQFFVLNGVRIISSGSSDSSYWQVGEKRYESFRHLGVTITGSIADGDGFGWEATARMNFQSALMPTKYRETNGQERFYNAYNQTYIDPDTGKTYVFENTYDKNAPSEYIYRNEKIKPTIEGIKNSQELLFGAIAAIAFDSDDNDSLKANTDESSDKNDTLKYEHSFFYIKLNRFDGSYGFDLLKHATQTDPMTIQMTSGPCNGCKFKVQVLETTDNGLEVWSNPVQTKAADGDIVEGSYADKVRKDSIQPWQQDTSKNSIWICVQKDAETFGVIVPNKASVFRPNVGDTFNIINIDLPLAYVKAAEKQLETEGIRFMADNNEDKFTFSINASRIFFAENPGILQQIDAYSKLRIEYNGIEYELYVSDFTIECKDSEALPDIKMELTDTLAVGESFVSKVANQAASLIYNPYTMSGGGGGGVNLGITDSRYLNKTRGDRSPYKIASDTAFEVGNFISGASGGIFFADETGKTWLETDVLKVRMKAVFEELLVSKINTVSGELMVTPGGSVEISYVEELDDAYRCYFKAKEEEQGVKCSFIADDQVICRQFNIAAGTSQDASNRYYWRVVKAVNSEESYVDLAKSGNDANGVPLVDGVDVPMIGDVICQLGYRGAVTRQTASRKTAIVISTVDADAPSIQMFSGITEFALNKRVIGFGYDKITGSAYFMVGDSNDPQYLTYTQKSGLKVKGEISVESPLSNGGTLGDALAAQESVYRVELTQTTGAVQCDADGNITATASQMPSTQVIAYKGNTQIDYSDSPSSSALCCHVDSINTTAGVTFYNDTTRPAGTFKMSSAKMTADTASVTFYVGIYENGTKVATIMSGMSIYKVRPGQGGAPGENGQSAIRLVLSQEVIGVPCDVNGVPTSGFFPVQITASLFRGDKATEGAFYPKDEEGCTTTQSGATITVTEMTADTATFTVVGTETTTGVSAQLNVSLYKVIPGTPGEPAVVYTLEPSVMVIKRDIDGTAEPNAVSCIVYKTTGNTDRVPTDDNKLYYRRINPTLSGWTLISRNNGQSGQVIVTSTTEEIIFGLFGALSPTLDTQPLALARIPVLTDAAGLEGSGVNLLRNTNQGTRSWTNHIWAQNSDGNIEPSPLPTLTESDSVPPGVVETNFYKYPFGETAVSAMPTIVEYQMFFNLPKSITLQKGKKYTLAFDAKVTFRGTDLELDYGITTESRESLGKITPITASVIRVQKTFTIDANADKTVSNIFVYVRLTNANVDGTGDYAGKGRSQFDSIEIKNLKLEKGSLATAWTPAPDDMHYLTQAFRESTTISGGVVMTSRVRVGYTDNNGAWHETGGLNGIAADYESNVVPTAPILYCGGEMIDKGDPEYTSSANSATSMIRLDGSAYFANNTVRFRENAMEMGDYIILQDDGLRLLDPASGEEKLFITNGSVGAISDISSVAPQAVSVSRTMQLYFYRQEQVSSGSLSLQNGYYLKRINQATPMYIYDNGNSAIQNANTTLQVTVTINFTVPSWDTSMLMKASLAVVLQSAANGSYTWADVARYSLYPANTSSAQTTFTASADILSPLSKGMKYRLTVLCTKDEAPKFAENLAARTMTAKGIGNMRVSQRKTVLGNDGFATVWGNTAVLVKENEAHLVQNNAKVDLQHSKTVISQGNTIFEIDAGTIKMTSEWNGNYTTFHLAPGGILIDTPEVTPRQERQLDLKKLADAGYFS